MFYHMIMHHLFLITLSATFAATFAADVNLCRLNVRFNEDLFLSSNIRNIRNFNSTKIKEEWVIIKKYVENVNFSVFFQEDRTKKFLAVTTGNKINFINASANNIWRRLFELKKLSNTTFNIITLVSGTTDNISKVMFNGDKFILSNVATVFNADVINGCEDIFPQALSQKTTAASISSSSTTSQNIATVSSTFTSQNIATVSSTFTSQNIATVSSGTFTPQNTIVSSANGSNILDRFLYDKLFSEFPHSKSKDNDKIILNKLLNIEIHGLIAANNLSDGGFVVVNSPIADAISSKQKLPFNFGLSDQSSLTNGIEVEGRSNDFMAMFASKYKNIHTSFSDNIQIEDNGMVRSGYFVNSILLSAIVANQSVVEKVTVKLHHLNQSGFEESVCAFWNSSGKGFWSTIGCKTFYLSNYSTTCLCSHLTNFAILTSVKGFQISKTHQKALNTITLIFSGLSIFFLIIGIIIILLILIGYKKRTKHIIHLNLMISLLIAQTVFVFGVDAVKYKVLCKSVAYILHYFWLATFGWMLIEGIYLYIVILKVFAEPKKYIRIYFLTAWGIPLFIVVITNLINKNAYSVTNHCWLSNSYDTVWAFLGPVLGIIVINGSILLMVLIQIVKLNNSNKLSNNLRAGFRSSIILLPILGVTWIFGYLSFGSETLFFQYIFAVLNSAQGFLLTLFHCFLNEEIWTSFKRRLSVVFYSSKFSDIKFENPLLSRTSYNVSCAQQSMGQSAKCSFLSSNAS
ncbi:adhesion G-protein coupled receptor D1 isoform X2 [Hydra vulgaris]|uniref:adhesion G-protein coupled receptor D1 isoform X2 n=1 Tax=Hydra vulgaris TaxID=6087 RepID=UPI001F5F7C79|nr:adhesion G-protein coupled receptor D1 isoform X1 [Hydra vulgaris]